MSENPALAENPSCADSGNRAFVNPILSGDCAAPSVLKVNDTYYMTHSCFEYGPQFLIWKSKNLVHWQPIDYAGIDVSGMHHETFGDWLSLRIGLCVCGEGAVEFRDFRYNPMPDGFLDHGLAGIS